MFWIPLGLLAASLTIFQTRKLVGVEGGLMGLALPLVFSASALWLLGIFFVTNDMLALAQASREAVQNFDAANTRLNTGLLALFGLGIGFAGAGRAAGLVVVAMSDPDEPAPAMFLPIFAALVGGAMVLLAYSRI